MADEIAENLEETLMGRTGERDFFVFYHHTGGIMPIMRISEEEYESEAEVETVILETLVRSDPTDFMYLRLLGDKYTRSGRIEDGLRVDLTLSTLFPEDATVFYNLACSWSMLNQIDKAVDAFSRAMQLGWDNLEFALDDEDLRNLRRDPRFMELTRHLLAGGEEDLPA